MTGADPLDDALDAAIDALQRGRPLDAVVADHGPSGAALRPLLEAADAARQSVTPPPPSPGLEHNYAILRAAVERAQMAAALPHGPTPSQAPWWRRRLAFASLSLPVSALVLALTAGAAGAASLVATDLGSTLGDFVSPVLPDAVTDHGGDRGPAPAANSENAGASDDAPGVDNRPTEVTLEGTVSDVNGNSFTLTVGDDVYHVQIDSNTEVDGEILEGATAEVTGDRTAEKNLHATEVSAAGGTPEADDKQDDAGTPDAAATPDDKDKDKDNDEQDEAGDIAEPSATALPEGRPATPPGHSSDPPEESGDDDEQQ